MVTGTLWGSVVAMTKIGMGRRLLQGFEEGIKGLFGEHMDFINNKNLISTLGRQVLNIFPEFPNFIDAAITGAVDFQDIKAMPLGYLQTGRTLIAGRGSGTV